MRFLHLSDTHIDYKPQLEYIKNENAIIEDRLNGIKSAIEYAKINGISLIIHAGDVFNTPSPKLNMIYELEKILSDAGNSGIEFLIISGNHDQSKIKSNFNSLKLFDLVKNVHIFIEDGIYSKDGYEFMCIPAKHDWSKLKETFPLSLNKLIDVSKSNKRILITHIPLSSANESSTFDIETLSDTIDVNSIPNIFLYVALGHYHGMQQVNNSKIYYSGSTSQLSFNEEFEKKYFLDVSIDENNTTVNAVEIIPNYPLHTIKINASYVSNYQDFSILLKHEIDADNKKCSIENKIVRVIISKLISSVRLNLDKDKIISLIKTYNPFGIKIIIERDKDAFSEDDEEDVEKLIGDPKNEISSFLDRNKKRTKLVDEMNDEIFNRAKSLNGDYNDYKLD